MNPNNNKFHTRGGKLYNNRGKPWLRKNNGSPKPTTSKQVNLDDNEFNSTLNNGPYNAWNLYFPEEGNILQVFID